MNKQEYMDKLSKALESFGSEIKDEIVSDYEEHFQDGLAGGKSEEQIISELGSVEDLVEELKGLSDGSADNVDEEAQREKFEQQAKKTFDDISKAFASFVGSMAAGITKGAGKIGEELSGGAGDFAKSMSNAADVVANKSKQFAKDIAESYRNARGPVETEEQEYEGEELITSVAFSDITEVIAETDCADIVVEPSADGSVHFDCDYDATPGQKLGYKIDYHCEDGKAYAIIKKKSATSGFFKKLLGPETLYVKIPDRLERINLSSLSGDVDVSNVTVKRADLKTMSGDVVINAVNNKDVYASTMSGDVNAVNLSAVIAELKTISGDVEFSGDSENLSVSSTSGDLNVKAERTKVVRAVSVSGDINLELEGIDGYNAKVDTKSGDIDLFFGNEAHEDVKRGTYTLGSGACDITASSVSGDIKVEA